MEDNPFRAAMHFKKRESIAPISESSDATHIDLHISVLPKNFWNIELNCAPYQSISDAITIGFVRCHTQGSVVALRNEIDSQLKDDPNLPHSYIFLKGVGRALVPIRPKQENLLTVENFKSIGSRLPPEIVLIETKILGKMYAKRGSNTKVAEGKDFVGQPEEDIRNRTNSKAAQKANSVKKKVALPTPLGQKQPSFEKAKSIETSSARESKKGEPKKDPKKELRRSNAKNTSVKFPPLVTQSVDNTEIDDYPTPRSVLRNSVKTNKINYDQGCCR